MASPSSCGFPDATNTGANCAALPVHQGDLDVTASVSNLNVKGSITVSAGNVTLTNVCATAAGGAQYALKSSGHSGVVFDHVTLVGIPGQCSGDVVQGDGFTLEHANISGCGHGVSAWGDETIADSYIHDLDRCCGNHNDGVHSSAGSNITVRHNTIRNPGSQTSTVYFGTDLGPISGVFVTNNLLDGGNYSIYWGGPGAGSMSVTNNRFGCDDVYGLMSNASPFSQSGNVWDGSGHPVTMPTPQGLTCG